MFSPPRRLPIWASHAPNPGHGFKPPQTGCVVCSFVSFARKACPTSDGAAWAEETYADHTYEWWADVNGSIAPVRDTDGYVTSIVAFHRYSHALALRVHVQKCCSLRYHLAITELGTAAVCS